MLDSVEGVFRDGRVELSEIPPKAAGSRVVVTFLDSSRVLLAEHGIDQAQALELRNRLQSFAEDWDRPEMDVYDAE